MTETTGDQHEVLRDADSLTTFLGVPCSAVEAEAPEASRRRAQFATVEERGRDKGLVVSQLENTLRMHTLMHREAALDEGEDIEAVFSMLPHAEQAGGQWIARARAAFVRKPSSAGSAA